MNSEEREEQARKRFIILNILRLSGAIVVIPALPSALGACSRIFHLCSVTCFVILGMIEFFLMPILLKKSWNRDDAGQGLNMRRFWKTVGLEQGTYGHGIRLDGRALKNAHAQRTLPADQGFGGCCCRGVGGSGGTDRTREYADDGLCQCRDRSCRARSRRICCLDCRLC